MGAVFCSYLIDWMQGIDELNGCIERMVCVY